MLAKERYEWKKAVHDVVRSLRRERSRNKKHQQEINKRLEKLNNKGYHMAGKQKRKEIEAAAYSKPLSCFGLKRKRFICQRTI